MKHRTPILMLALMATIALLFAFDATAGAHALLIAPAAAVTLEGLPELAQAFKDQVDGVKQQNEQLEARLHAIEQNGQRSPGGNSPTESLGMKLAADPRIQELRERKTRSVIVPLDLSLKMLRKAVVSDGGSSGDWNVDLPTQRLPNIVVPGRMTPRIIDVLPSIPVNSGAFEFLQMSGPITGAAYQEGQGAEKPEGDGDTTLKSVSIATIAVTLPVSEQVLSDLPQLGNFLTQQLIASVLDKLDSEVVEGDGVTGHIMGLTTQATAFSPTSSGIAAADAIGEAQVELQTSGWQANAVLLHPTDWQAIRSERAAGDGHYIGGGWNAPAPPNVWGVPVVTSASVPAGTALVLDTNQVLILDRMQVNVQIGLVNDQFKRNMVTMRAELRAGLAVLNTSAVLEFSI